MPNKKGSRVAASQARSQAKAKKKARSGGPLISTAPYRAPGESDEVEEQPDADAVIAAAVEPDGASVEPATPPAVRAAAPARRVRTVPRRERQALVAVQGGSLMREVSLIGAVTALAGIALAVLKLATDIGR
jgi:hypothetical protein